MDAADTETDTKTAAPVDETGAAIRAGDLSFGLMRIGGALLALPVEAIREVVPGQSTYAPLAAWATGIIGAINLRGWVIPIFDARGSLGMPTPILDDHVILILRLDGRLLGLVAERVCGIARIAPDHLFALNPTGTNGHDTGLTTHAFQMDEDVASLMDARRIARIPGLPTVAERIISRQSETINSEKLLLFSCGTRHFGIEATAVDATVPPSIIDRNQLASGACLGVIDHQFYATPVVDTASVLGFGMPSPLNEASAVVVRFSGTAMIGFLVDEVREIATVVRSRIVAMPSALGRTPMLRGIYTDEAGREHLILDPAHLRDNPQLAVLANLRKPKLGVPTADTARAAGRGEASAVSGGATQPYLTYTAGAERATALTQIIEILPFPTHIVPFPVPDVGIVGLFTHQGKAIPLICVATRYGRPSSIDPARSRVLLATDGAMRAAFVVDSLRSIEPAHWKSSTRNSDADTLPRRAPLVMVGAGAERRMVYHVDLVAEIRALSASMHDRFVMPPATPEQVEALRA